MVDYFRSSLWILESDVKSIFVQLNTIQQIIMVLIQRPELQITFTDHLDVMVFCHL